MWISFPFSMPPGDRGLVRFPVPLLKSLSTGPGTGAQCAEANDGPIAPENQRQPPWGNKATGLVCCQSPSRDVPQGCKRRVRPATLRKRQWRPSPHWMSAARKPRQHASAIVSLSSLGPRRRRGHARPSLSGYGFLRLALRSRAGESDAPDA